MTEKTKILTIAQIDDVQEAAFNALQEEGYNGGMGGFQWDRASARAIEQAVLQSQEIQSLKKDAERYRALRNSENQFYEDDISVCDSSFNTYFEEELDRAVDALIARNRDMRKEQS